MNKKNMLMLVAVVLMSIFVLKGKSQEASAQEDSTPSDKWQTYSDPRFDFSVEYPSNWEIILRDDSDPDALSGFVTFVPTNIEELGKTGENNHDPHEASPQIVIGLYLSELADDQPLDQWTELYEAVSNPDPNFAESQLGETLIIDQKNAVRGEVVSSLATYQFTNIAYEKTVWFIWTDIVKSEDDPFSVVYERMIKSFKFGSDAPKNLQDAYGDDFKPSDLEEDFLQEGDIDKTSKNKKLLAFLIPSISSSWRAPVNGYANVRCGSELHTGKSAYAADIGVYNWSPVYAAQGGTVTFSGWVNNSYGNLITINSGGKIAYYAHLSFVFPQVGAYVGKSAYIAASGNTSTWAGMPYHLHFHVEEGNSPVNLTGMSGFTVYYYSPGNPKYPGSPGTYVNCGQMN